MKKIICLVLCLSVLNACSTKKVIFKYESTDNDSIIKEYKITENKKTKVSYSNLFPCFQGCLKTDTNLLVYFLAVVPVAFDLVIAPFQIIFDTIPKTSYTYTSYANIEGKIINSKEKPIENKNLSIQYNTLTNTVVSDKNGIFKTEFDIKTEETKEKQNSFNHTITLDLENNYDINELNNNFKEGQDVSVINPIKLTYTYPFNKIEKTIFSADDINIKQSSVKIPAEKMKNNIILSEKIFSSQYYKKIEEKKEKSKIKAQKILEKSGFYNADIYSIILDANNNLKQNWEQEVKNYIKEENNRKKKEKRIKEIANKIDNNLKISNYDKEEIKKALDRYFNVIYDSYLFIQAVRNCDKGKYVFFQPIIIRQIIMKQGFLATIGNSNNYIYIEYTNTEDFFDGELVEIYAKVIGTFSYQNTFGAYRTIPKLKGYIVNKAYYYY